MDSIIFTLELDIFCIVEILQIICVYFTTFDLMSLYHAFPFLQVIIETHIRENSSFLLNMTSEEIGKLKKDGKWNALLKSMVEETNMGKEINVFPKENYYTLIVKGGIVRQFSRALHNGDMNFIQYFLKKQIDLVSILEQIKDKKGSLRECEAWIISTMWGSDRNFTKNLNNICGLHGSMFDSPNKNPNSIVNVLGMTYWQMKDIIEVAYTLKKTPVERKLLDSIITKFKNLLINEFGRYYDGNTHYIKEYFEPRSIMNYMGSLKMIVEYPIVYLTIFISPTRKVCIEALDLINTSIKFADIYEYDRLYTQYVLFFQNPDTRIFKYGGHIQHWNGTKLVNKLVNMLPEEPLQVTPIEAVPEVPMAISRNGTPCKFFRQGRCSNGSSCRFVHD